MDTLILSGFSDEIAPDFDTQLRVIRELGLNHIELRSADGVNISDLTDDKLQEIKSKLKNAGVRVSSIGSPIGKTAITEDFSAQPDRLKRTIEIAHVLGAPYIRIFSFYIPKGEDPALYREEVLERLHGFTEAAKGSSVTLLHENEKGIYGDNAPRCLELLKALAGPDFGAVFDFANFVEVGQPPKEAYELLKPYIRYVHVKDAVWDTKQIVPAGQGDGHLAEILGDLIGNEYRGVLSLEPHLVNFSGLAALEKDPTQRKATLTGPDAFHLAVTSLRELLAQIPAAREVLA